MIHRHVPLYFFVSFFATQVAISDDLGSQATAVEPSEWINAKPGFAWKDLKGHLVLVEKWATWCAPCRTSIPHLNELKEKYGKQGLSIIGVTEEPAAKVKPFVEEQGMKYLIALGGAAEYKTNGIPAAWLVSPKGTIVWQGHPMDLKEATIEEHLKDVRLAPVPALPKELKAVEKDLAAGDFGGALKALETHLKKPKSTETEAAAKDAVEKLQAHAKTQLEESEKSAKDGNYYDAVLGLEGVQKSYKGTEFADKAKDTLAAWKKDKAVKVELDGVGLVQKAEALLEAKQYKNAAAYLVQVAKTKKFDETKIQARAKKMLSSVEKKMGST
jgi:thiol-disulfide isomerase/thioredoxin